MKHIVWLTCLVIMSASANANVSLDITLGSKHINASDRNYNEVNPGIGARWTTPKDNWSRGVAVGAYKNSINNTSVYLMGVIQHRLVEQVDVGIQAGFVTGYNTLPADVLGGVLFLERPFGGIVGRVAFIPPHGDNSGVIGIQIGVPFGE